MSLTFLTLYYFPFLIFVYYCVCFMSILLPSFLTFAPPSHPIYSSWCFFFFIYFYLHPLFLSLSHPSISYSFCPLTLHLSLSFHLLILRYLIPLILHLLSSSSSSFCSLYILLILNTSPSHPFILLTDSPSLSHLCLLPSLSVNYHPPLCSLISGLHSKTTPFS